MNRVEARPQGSAGEQLEEAGGDAPSGKCCFSDKLAHWRAFEILVCSLLGGVRAALPCISGVTVIKQQNVT